MACKDVLLCLVNLCAILAAGQAEDSDRFHYDYKSLRIGGLVFAGAMLIMGVSVLLTDLKLIKKRRQAVTEARSEA
ncbi:phospholemman-like [Pseudophryne corroboree]|uniref:phospholemman-like n=1 Tax=Pseudophryne corroboree TaxID=495146 RepID=UPI0030812A64